MIKRVDLFGKPVALNFNGKDKSRSFTGAGFSLLVFAFVIWSIYHVGMDIVLRKSPKTILSQAYYENPEPMYLSNDTFNFAFGLQDPVNIFHYIDDSIYTADLYHTALIRTTNPDGTPNLEWVTTPLEKEICTIEHWGKLGEKFVDIELNQLFCIKREQSAFENIRIQGVFESPIYEYVGVDIKRCVNGTVIQNCQSNETIDQAMGGFFAAYFNNMAIDPKNYSNPNIEYRDSYYTSLSYPYYKEVALWLSHVEMNSDIGWLTEDNRKMEFIQFEKTVENLALRQDMGKVLTFVARVSKVKTIYERSYTKIQGIFAEINGLAAAAIVATAFFLRPYSNIKFYEGLINELFDVKDLKDSKDNQEPKSPKKNREEKKFERKQTAKRNTKSQSPSSPSREKGLQFLKIDMSENQAVYSNPASPKGLLSMSNLPLNSPGKRDLGDLESPQREVRRNSKPKDILEKKKNGRKKSPQNSINDFIGRSIETQNEGKKIEKGKDLEFGSLRITSKSVATEQGDAVEGLESKYNNDFTSGNIASRVSTYKSRLLTNKPGNVKPQLKMLDNFEAKSLTEIDIILESLIMDKENQQKEKEIYKKREGESNRDKNKKIEEDSIIQNDQSRTFEKQLEEIGDIEDQTFDEAEIEMKAKELPAKLHKEHDKINITFWDYVGSYIWKTKAMKEKTALLREGIRRIEERLDIFNVLKKFREVDKLKLLLLESEQLVLFDTLPKPELAPTDITETTMDKETSKDKLKESKFISDKRRNDLIAKAYGNLKRKNSKTIIDARLLDVFDDIVES